jgi:hypothetical protein
MVFGSSPRRRDRLVPAATVEAVGPVLLSSGVPLPGISHPSRTSSPAARLTLAGPAARVRSCDNEHMRT